jgi:hypothetical protein
VINKKRKHEKAPHLGLLSQESTLLLFEFVDFSLFGVATGPKRSRLPANGGGQEGPGAGIGIGILALGVIAAVLRLQILVLAVLPLPGRAARSEGIKNIYKNIVSSLLLIQKKHCPYIGTTS